MSLLIVEDCGIQRELTRAMADLCGLFSEIHTATGVDDAWEQLRGLAGPEANWRSWIVLSDFRMPGPDGIALVQRLREHDRLSELRVLLVTGAVRPEDSRRAEELNCQLIEKPTSLSDFTKLFQRSLALEC